MKWKIVLRLSLLGVPVGFAGVYGLSGNAALAVWLIVFVVFAVVIARSMESDFFVHALLASILAGLFVGIIHAAFINSYIAHNAQLNSANAMMPKTSHPRLLMVVLGPFIGAVTGVVAGLMAVAAGRIMKKKIPASPDV